MHDASTRTTPPFEDLAAGYRPQVLRHVRAMVRDAEVAEELTQETLTRALAASSSLRDPQAALGWLYRIATNVCVDYLRRRRPAFIPLGEGGGSDGEIVAATAKERPLPSIETGLEQGEMSECVQRYLGTLREDYRIALLLHDVYGLSNPEIAELVGCSLATAKIRVHRARRRLHEALTAACEFSQDERGVLVCEPQTSVGDSVEARDH